MDKKVFIEYVNKIDDYIKKEEAIDTALRALSPDFGGFTMGDTLSDMVNLLKLCVGDVNDNLGYYVWEYDCGRSSLADSVTEADGTSIPFRTPEDVYNLIMEEQIDTKDDSITNYLLEERDKYKKLYENEKDHSETLQRIIDRTMDNIVDNVVSEDIKETQKKTTTKGQDISYEDLVDTIMNNFLKEFEKNE